MAARPNSGVSAASDVTEQQEFDQIDELLRQASEIQISNPVKSRVLINEALEIDKTHPQALEHAVKINLRLSRYEEAYFHADTVHELQPESHLGFLLRGLVQLERHHYRDSIDNLLQALLSGADDRKTVTQLLADNVSNMLSTCKQLADKTIDQDYFTQLSNIGVALLDSNQNVLTIHILEAALQVKLENQHESCLVIHLTHGHACCNTKQYSEAQNSYRKCLELARKHDEYSYQTKALVNLASLYLRQGQTYEAIGCYETLIDLKSRIDNYEIGCDEVWTLEFSQRLFINLSRTYKTVNDLDRSIQYAQLAITMIEKNGKESELVELLADIGSVYQTLGYYSTTLKYYKRYLNMSKNTSNKRNQAHAYGLMASLFSQIGLYALSTVYHERDLSIVTGLLSQVHSEDRDSNVELKKACITATDLFGDTLMRRGLYDEASNMFMNITRFIDSIELIRLPLIRCTALYKIGLAQHTQSNSQHALHFYQQAFDLCDESYSQIYHDIQLGIAECLQNYTQSHELEKCRKIFDLSIEFYKTQIHHSITQRKYLPELNIDKLQRAYTGIQNVLSKLGCDLECLEYCEEMKLSILQREICHDQLINVYPDRIVIEDLVSCVRNSETTILYFSFLNNNLLIWAIQPDVGVARFFVRKPMSLKSSVEGEIREIMCGWYDNLKQHQSNSLYHIEKRHLQKPSDMIEQMKEAVDQARYLSAARPNTTKLSSKTELPSNNEYSDEQIERLLYKHILGPVDDLLSGLSDSSNVIIIPDKILYDVPYQKLRNLRGVQLSNSLQFTLLPSLFLLPRILLSSKTQEDSYKTLMKRRQETHNPHIQTSDVTQPVLNKSVNIKRTSNPRLTTYIRTEENKKSTTRKLKHPPDLKNDYVEGNYVQLIDSVNDLKQAVDIKPSSYIKTNCSQFNQQPNNQGNTTPRKKTIPQPSYHKPLVTRGTTTVKNKLAHNYDVTTLISNTSTGTAVFSSNLSVTEYKQICEEDKCVVIGIPHVQHDTLKLGDGFVSTAGLDLSSQLKKREVDMVCEVFNVEPITQTNAHKDKFLQIVTEATVLHIVTDGSLMDGYFVMSADPCLTSIPVPERQYCINCSDIVKLELKAKLVLLSCGWKADHSQPGTNQLKLHKIASAFLTAGAQCVITLPYPLHEAAVLIFIRCLYECLYDGEFVSRAYSTAIDQLSISMSLRFSPVMIFGKNVFINIREMKRVMLDENINELENHVIQEMTTPPLNQPKHETVETMGEILLKIQNFISYTIKSQSQPEVVFSHICSLVQKAIKRLENISRPPSSTSTNREILSTALLSLQSALSLLKSIGFQFLPRGLTERVLNPTVMFPVGDPDCILPRVRTVCTSILGLSPMCKINQLLSRLLPVEQTTLSQIIDVLLYTKHSPQLTLNVEDTSVSALWFEEKCHLFLLEIGYQAIGNNLHWHDTHKNRDILQFSLKLLLCLSTERDLELYDRLDISDQSDDLTRSENAGTTELTTLQPVILQHNKIVRTVPWSSRIESTDEMSEKQKIANKVRAVRKRFQNERKTLNSLQTADLSTHAAEVLDQIAVSQPLPDKLRVLPGFTASRDRVRTDYIPPLTAAQLNQRRKYADYVVKYRDNQAKLREEEMINRILLPYCRNMM